MKFFMKKFSKDEIGAVTVDWVVLSASVVLLLGAGYGAMESGATDLSDNVSTYMSTWSF